LTQREHWSARTSAFTICQLTQHTWVKKDPRPSLSPRSLRGVKAALWAALRNIAWICTIKQSLSEAGALGLQFFAWKSKLCSTSGKQRKGSWRSSRPIIISLNSHTVMELVLDWGGESGGHGNRDLLLKGKEKLKLKHKDNYMSISFMGEES